MVISYSLKGIPTDYRSIALACLGNPSSERHPSVRIYSIGSAKSLPTTCFVTTFALLQLNRQKVLVYHINKKEVNIDFCTSIRKIRRGAALSSDFHLDASMNSYEFGRKKTVEIISSNEYKRGLPAFLKIIQRGG
jgi:hypothetical protein